MSDASPIEAFLLLLLFLSVGGRDGLGHLKHIMKLTNKSFKTILHYVKLPEMRVFLFLLHDDLLLLALLTLHVSKPPAEMSLAGAEPILAAGPIQVFFAVQEVVFAAAAKVVELSTAIFGHSVSEEGF